MSQLNLTHQKVGRAWTMTYRRAVLFWSEVDQGVATDNANYRATIHGSKQRCGDYFWLADFCLASRSPA